MTEADLMAACYEAESAGEEYADFMFVKETLHQMRDAYLASLKMEKLQENLDVKISETALDRMAMGTKEWRDFCEAQRDEYRKAGQKKIRYENAQRRWESIRSAIAIRREEVRRFGG